MTDNVIDFPGHTTLDLNPDKILKNNIGRFRKIILVGVEEDGTIVGCSSIADKATIIYLAECLKFQLLSYED